MSESRIRLVDLDEHDLVITVRSTGEVEVELNADAPAGELAHVLVEVARKLHPPVPCTSKPEPTATEPAAMSTADLAPMMARGGSLDGDRWTDGHGHTWDLSLSWGDDVGQQWMWAGWFDRGGAPMMRETSGGEQMPLDAVRVVFGPITPSAGGAS